MEKGIFHRRYSKNDEKLIFYRLAREAGMAGGQKEKGVWGK